MKEIAKGVYIEDTYPGVQVAALILPKGGVLIDAPTLPEDARAWLASLRGTGMSGERLVINLDSHPDRTLGVRHMECVSMAHVNVKPIFKNRPAIFKAQRAESGAEWELLSGLSGVRWQRPSIHYSKHSHIRWGNNPIILEHHPGPERGATWVVLPEEKILFIGDTVLLRQPPFLAEANLEAWTESLDLLLSKDYNDYRMFSSRNGEIKEKDIREMKKVLKEIEKRMTRLGRRRGNPETTEGWVEKLFSASNSLKKHKTQYTQRLRYGLKQYYTKTYLENEQS